MAVDAYISSAKKVHVSMLLLTISVIYFSNFEMERRTKIQQLAAIDRVLLLRKNFEPSEFRLGIGGYSLMKESDLPWVYLNAATDQGFFRLKQILNQRKEDNGTPAEDAKTLPKLFPEKEIGRSYILSDQSLRTSYPGQCNISVITANSESDIPFWYLPDSLMPGPVNGDDIFLINFSTKCYFKEASAIIIKNPSDNKKWVLGLTKMDFEILPRLSPLRGTALGMSDLLGPRQFSFKDEYLTNMPESLMKYAFHDDEYVLLEKKTIDLIVISLAQKITGNIYSIDDIDNAVSDVFHIRFAETGLLGLKVKHNLFLLYSPLFIFILTYVFYRRMQHIEARYTESKEPWILIGFSRKIDKLLSYVWGFSPTICVLIVYAFVGPVLGGTFIGFKIFSRFFDLLEMSHLPWYWPFHDIDPYASFLLFFFAFHMYFTILSQIYIWRILKSQKLTKIFT